MTQLQAGVDRLRLADLYAAELQRFAETHPGSLAAHERGRESLLYGVPMNWMTRWPGRSPVVVAEARGAHLTDVDGNRYVDLCLGDTGAMAGHAPAAVVEAVAAQVARGVTTMLPSTDANAVGEEMARRFGLPLWQFALTATDANRFVLRWARELTGRPKVVVHNFCYHGSVDETVAQLGAAGEVRPRPGSIGPQVDPALTTKVVEINDLPALEAALAEGDVAAVLIEPVLTNIGIVLPDEGYHAAVRELTRRYGTLLVIDETHTICAGPGGYTRAHDLEPDFLTIGKTIAGGIPAAAYGVSAEVGERIVASTSWIETDVGGIGGTLAGNALSLAATRATLTEVLTEAAFERMTALAVRFTAGVEAVIAEHGLPWHVTRLGCRAEYLFRAERPRNGAEADAGGDLDLDAFIHLFMLNRGILLTPFHNMALMSPATTEADVDRHSELFAEAAALLLA
ncbi:aspartate aminotransferase family protein [Jatrophihabitans sp.]|uniref:aspartate aminotransferase family protein n=1 Tax=Jatrophihabitans sp. TaxID=1932789 RepID=UPI0030C6D032|nr:aminotransferase [Jatrophihabitans sp.]